MADAALTLYTSNAFSWKAVTSREGWNHSRIGLGLDMCGSWMGVVTRPSDELQPSYTEKIDTWNFVFLAWQVCTKNLAWTMTVLFLTLWGTFLQRWNGDECWKMKWGKSCAVWFLTTVTPRPWSGHGGKSNLSKHAWKSIENECRWRNNIVWKL